jgi:hypothetical protein
MNIILSSIIGLFVGVILYDLTHRKSKLNDDVVKDTESFNMGYKEGKEQTKKLLNSHIEEIKQLDDFSWKDRLDSLENMINSL